jgi:biopolymer transport protein ExbD
MPVEKPQARLGHHFKMKALKGAHKGKKGLYQNLNLTAMVDMLTIFVVFLLMTFSATGELNFIQKDIKMPDATKVKSLETAHVVSVSPPGPGTPGFITLDGRKVAETAELQKKEGGGDWKIAQLTETLEIFKNNDKLTQSYKGNIIVQCDRQVEFKVLKQVMYSTALAGYGNINFAVNQKGDGAAVPHKK